MDASYPPEPTKALFHAISLGRYDAVVQVLERFSFPSYVVNETHRTPLGQLAWHTPRPESHKIAHLLIEHGFEINSRHPHVDPTLYDLVGNSYNLKLIQAAIDAGAQVPLEWGDDDVENQLLALPGKEEVLCYLLDLKAAEIPSKEFLQFPLRQACSRSMHDYAKALLAAGACPNSPYEMDNELTLVLDIVARVGSEDMTRLLLNYGANPLFNGRSMEQMLHRAKPSSGAYEALRQWWNEKQLRDHTPIAPRSRKPARI